MPLGPCPQCVPGRARCLLPYAYWTVQWWVVAMTVFFHFRTGIKILPLATFFLIALKRAASLLRFWGTPGLCCYTLTPRATIWLVLCSHSSSNCSSHLFLESNLSWAVDHSVFLCFWKSQWNNLSKCSCYCRRWQRITFVTPGNRRIEIGNPSALWQGWFSRMQ